MNSHGTACIEDHTMYFYFWLLLMSELNHLGSNVSCLFNLIFFFYFSCVSSAASYRFNYLSNHVTKPLAPPRSCSSSLETCPCPTSSDKIDVESRKKSGSRYEYIHPNQCVSP